MDDVRPVFVCCGSDALSHSLEYDLPSPVYVEVHTEKEKNDTDAARSIVSSQKMAIDINPYLRCESKLKKSCIAVKILKGFTFSTRPRLCLMESLSSRFV